MGERGVSSIIVITVVVVIAAVAIGSYYIRTRGGRGGPQPPYPIVSPEMPLFLGPGLPDLTVALPAVPLITAIKSGYSNDLTPRAPWPTLYNQDEFPPVAAAALVGNGRVVAIANSILRDSYFDLAVLSNEQAMSDIVRWMENWMDPKGDRLTYFCTEAALGTYYLPSMVRKYLSMLENIGFDVENQVGGEITTKLLENVDLLNIAELMRPLSDNEIQAITDWVMAGGRLIIMCQSDNGGFSRPSYPNAVLKALNVPIAFQDDEVFDDNNWVIDGPWFPQVYFIDPRQVNPNFDVWFATYEFSAIMPTQSLTANNVQVLFPFTISNTGTRDSSYKIKVQETSTPLLGWNINWWPTEVSIKAGENIEGYITVTVPKIVSGLKRMNLLLTVTDQTLTFLMKSITFTVLGDYRVTILPTMVENGQIVNDTLHPEWGKVIIIDFGYSGGGAWTYVVKTTSGEIKIVFSGCGCIS